MYDDPEVEALRVAYEALSGLPPDAKVRGVEWLSARLYGEAMFGADAAGLAAMSGSEKEPA